MENMNNPRRLWKTFKHAAPTQPILKTPSFIEMDGQQITDPLSMANAFNDLCDHFIDIQSSVNSNVTVDDQAQADINAGLSDLIKARKDDSTQFNIPSMTTPQVEENIKRIAGHKATGLDGIGIKIIKLALPTIAQSLTHIYNAIISKVIFLYSLFTRKARLTTEITIVMPVISKPLERLIILS